MGLWSWVNFQCRGVLLVWIIIWQGPTVLEVGAGSSDIFSHLSFLSSISPSLEDSPIKTEIMSQRAVNPKTTNHPNLIHGHNTLIEKWQF